MAAAADPSPFAVIAGGGTGGHVVPALAIGRALVARGHPPSSLHYVGSERGIEARLVPEAGFPLTLLPGRGIQRRLTAENVEAVWGLARASSQAVALLRRLRPRVVVVVGGYASVPCAVAAAALRVPIVVQEQNAVPGAANRLTARVARAAAVAYPGTPLPRAVVTGNPVRPEVLAVSRSAADRAAARSALGLPAGRRVVGVVGGSLGALRINRAVLAALGRWAGRADLAVHHVVGERDWDLVGRERPAPADGGLWYRAVRYEDRLPLVMAAADVCVSRAGGNTVAELAVLGAPSVLVPLPGAPGDHQTANARVLVEAGGAVLVPDAELDGDRLAAEVDALLADDGRLAAMGSAAAGAGRRDAADQVAALVEEHARA
ncbi:MAG TPA: undecaprenyldiphospho-muramoylpentapeptide beta-N-acetylglucosaminyltransferase [Acidimicrobiales bacterium]|nr:undecaprenyldiphospho-muramoylpentapeptide beta-N-acetylglucosaminyltransferase [Acidimicrobiales bacterium]